MSTLRPKLAFPFYLCYNAHAFLENRLPGGGVKQDNYSALRINVGFLLHQSIGYSRKFEFSEASVQVADDLGVSHLTGNLTFTRTTQGLYAEGIFTATAPLECVRCLTDFNESLSIEINELYEFPPQKETDPQLAIPQSGIIDLTSLVSELFLLEIPIQPLCQVDCLGLCAICGRRLAEGQCDHPQMEIDPRLSVLQSLLPDS
jgi:uncharacterized protein